MTKAIKEGKLDDAKTLSAIFSHRKEVSNCKVTFSVKSEESLRRIRPMLERDDKYLIYEVTEDYCNLISALYIPRHTINWCGKIGHNKVTVKRASKS